MNRITSAEYNVVERSGGANQVEVTQQLDYYPFGLQQKGAGLFHAQQEPANRYQYNGKENIEEAGMLDYGARYYDPAVARWTSVNPLADSYASINPYAYVGNNPLKFIDPDGMRIVVPNEDDREVILNLINSVSKGVFEFNDAGELQSTGEKSKGRKSKAFTEDLLAGIKSDRTISIEIAQTSGDFQINDDRTITEDESSNPEDIDEIYAGGLTAGLWGSDQIVKITGNPSRSEEFGIYNMKDEPLDYEAKDLLIHELVGHAIPRITNSGAFYDNAIGRENKVRRQLKRGKRYRRREDARHRVGGKPRY